MSTKIILLPAGRSAETEYIKSIAEAQGLEVREKKYKLYTALGFELDGARGDKAVDRIIAEVITIFYKFRLLKNVIEGYKSDSYDYCAYLGALLSVELEEERKRVLSVVEGLREVALDSLMELRLKELTEGWQGLGELAEMLLMQCEEEDDVFALVPYFLGGEAHTPQLTVSGGDIPKLWNAGNEIKVPSLTLDPEKDLVIALMRERPTHIVIRNGGELGVKLLRTLRALGE